MTRATVLLAALAMNACATTILVRNNFGTPVGQADVYINGSRAGATDTSGKLTVALNNGDHLFARKQMYEYVAYRGNHGPGQGWVARAYQTSLVIQNDGSRVDSTVANRMVTQTLNLDPNNALIGLHIVASVYADASQDELSAIRDRFVAASEYLYNLTDGQFLIEQLELADDGQLWGSAEITFHIDNTITPFTTYIGAFLGPVALSAPIIRMPPTTPDSQTLIHEFGHLGFGLADEYLGFGAGPQYCTQARFTATGGPFMSGGAQASCAMDHERYSSKLCSNQPNNPHHGGTYQFGACWDTIRFSPFNDATSNPPRWILQTPDTRGAIPGMLPPIPAGLRPTITVMNRTLHDLCQPFVFTDPSGAAVANTVVWVRPSFWVGFDFTIGKLDYKGAIEAHGLHLGDKIVTLGSTVPVPVTASMCTVTN
jgi:hypothetical protein